MAVWDDTTTADLIENWWQNQYVSEVQTRWSCRNPWEHSRMLDLKRRRLASDISVWTCLEGESPPTKWTKKPTLPSLQKEAREAWTRADKTKAETLYYKWTHDCTDPYSCRMHGCGSD
jgi:hypothetical protein